MDKKIYKKIINNYINDKIHKFFSTLFSIAIVEKCSIKILISSNRYVVIIIKNYPVEHLSFHSLNQTHSDRPYNII